jgi:hypothetical protein
LAGPSDAWVQVFAGLGHRNQPQEEYSS